MTASAGQRHGRDLRLDGRVAVVTGGAGHVGAAICDTLAALGATVVVLDLHAKACAETAAAIAGRHGTDVWPLAIDLELEREVTAVPTRVTDRVGRLDVVVNCAALVGTSELEGWAVPFAEQRADTWRRALEINVTAAFVLSQAAAPALSAGGRGAIVNIGSIYGVVGPDPRLYTGTSLGNPAAYAVSKAGLLQLTRYLATVLAPSVRVNAVSLGGIERAGQPPSFVERYCSRTPLLRMGTEQDACGAVAFLASDAAAYVTGQNLIVDGGWTVW